jgi:hypothetical protein
MLMERVHRAGWRAIFFGSSFTRGRNRSDLWLSPLNLFLADSSGLANGRFI